MMKNLRTDEKGVIPLAAFIPWYVWAAFGGAAILGTYLLLRQPDVTYNISDTGFSLAGIDISWIIILAVVALGLFLLLAFRKPSQPQPNQPIILRRE